MSRDASFPRLEWDGKDITMMWPNQALHRTAICASVLPWGFCFICQFVAVGELCRSAASNAGGVEQEPTEGTETDSILCFLCYLLLNSEVGCLASVVADFFSCVSRGWRVPSPRSDITGRHCVF